MHFWGVCPQTALASLALTV